MSGDGSGGGGDGEVGGGANAVGDDTAAAGAVDVDIDAETGEVTVSETAMSSQNTGQDQTNIDVAYGMSMDPGVSPVDAQAAEDALGNAISEGGLGHLSVAGGLGANSETGATIAQIQGLMQETTDPTTGTQISPINIPGPVMGTPQFEQASNMSFTVGALNPTMAGLTNTIGLAMMPGPMAGAVSAMQHAQAAEMGLPAPSSILGGIMGGTGIGLVDETVSGVTDAVGQSLTAVGQGIGAGLNAGLSAVETGLDATVGAGFNALQEGLDDIGLGSSATPESMDADAVADVGAVGGEPEIPTLINPSVVSAEAAPTTETPAETSATDTGVTDAPSGQVSEAPTVTPAPATSAPGTLLRRRRRTPTIMTGPQGVMGGSVVPTRRSRSLSRQTLLGG